MRTLLRLAAGVAVLSLPALTNGSGRQTSPPPSAPVKPDRSPAGSATAQPQLTVSPRGVLLSWVERNGGRSLLKWAERTEQGWSSPRTAASGTDWFVNWADVPSVIRLDDRTLAAHWLQKSGGGAYAYDVRVAHSTDDGRSWSAGVTPHHDGTRTEHGFASLFALPGSSGGLGLIWLDGRATAPAQGGGHGGHGAGAMTLRFGRYDRSWRQAADAVIDDRVCDCCPTAAAMTAEGPVVAYRDRSDREVRDIALSRFDGGKWSPAAVVHADGWQINACPVNGPAIAARERQVVVAWFTAANDAPRAYAAFSTDAGRTFGAPVRLDENTTIGRVDVALLPDGRAAASYLETSAGRTHLYVRTIDRSGRRSAPVRVAAVDGGRSSGYPRIAHDGRDLIAAWTGMQGGITKVETAVVTLTAGAGN